MATIGLYVPGSQEGANALRSRLNEIAGELGYTAERGPTTGEGNLVDLLRAIDAGEVALVALSDGEARRARAQLEKLGADPAGGWARALLRGLDRARVRQYEAETREREA